MFCIFLKNHIISANDESQTKEKHLYTTLPVIFFMENIILEKMRQEINSSIPAQCRECGIELDNNNWFSSYQKRGNKICKKCHYKWYRNYLKEYRKKLRENLLDTLGTVCEKCGYNWRDEGHTIHAIEIHHKDPSTKGKPRETTSKELTKKTFKKIIELYDEGKVKLLCCRCHREEHA